MTKNPMKTLSSRVVYENRWMTVREDAIERLDGSHGIYSFVEKAPAVIIIPLEGTPEGGFVHLVEQLRYPVKKRYMEFPGGAWEDNREADPIEVARGELKEETGLVAGRMDHAGFLYFAYGMSNQGFHVYCATDLVQGEATPEATEQDLVLHRVSVREFEGMCRDGVIQDSASLSAWALLKAKWSSLRVGD